jgi:hypothetical protein
MNWTAIVGIIAGAAAGIAPVVTKPEWLHVILVSVAGLGIAEVGRKAGHAKKGQHK